jgi:hypothetical protein
MYFLEPYLVRPLTRALELSFAELVGPKRLDFFVSHFWGLAFVETLDALRKQAFEASSTIHKPSSEIAYWICTFSNNQWKLWEEIPPGADPSSSSFYKALTSGFCHATCMVVNEKVEPLKRSWCLFELFLTFVLKDRETWNQNEVRFEGLLLLTSSGVLNSGKSSMDIALAVTRSVASLNLEDASASRIEDAEMIKRKVIDGYGSFEIPNNKLKLEIRNILSNTQSRAQQDIDELLESLKVNHPQSNSATTALTGEGVVDCSITASELARASLLQTSGVPSLIVDPAAQAFLPAAPVEIELRQMLVHDELSP